MDNENKNLQGTENEDTLSPEEKVKEDIRSKIADAAAEVQDEITAADAVEETTEETLGAEQTSLSEDNWSDTEEDGVMTYEDPEFIEGEEDAEDAAPVTITINKTHFIISLVASALAGILLLTLCLQIPKWVNKSKEAKAIKESQVVSVDFGKKAADSSEIDLTLTEDDLTAYIASEAMTYAMDEGLNYYELSSYDWDQEVDGKKLSDTLKEKALDKALANIILVSKGIENGLKLDETDKKQLQYNSLQFELEAPQYYGTDDIETALKLQGFNSIESYNKYNTIAYFFTEKLEGDMAENPDKYYPEDLSVLNDYREDDTVAVKHILIKTDDSTATEEVVPAEGEAAPAEGEEAAPVVDERKALAESILERAQNGEDFDALVEEFNEDTSAPDEGYTFGPGEMMPEFEDASFALGIGEISGIVETSYGYHIIKRIPAITELAGYLRDQAGEKVEINDDLLAGLNVKDIMTDIEKVYIDILGNPEEEEPEEDIEEDIEEEPSVEVTEEAAAEAAE